MNEPTVSVSPVEGFDNALLMLWQTQVTKEDVSAAFKHISEWLDRADQPIYIVVDITSNPRFPLAETITSAFWGPFRHDMLAEWLVVGSSQLARTIGRTLTGITLKDNIRWFRTREEALGYLASKSGQR